MAESPAEYVARLEDDLRVARACAKSAAATAAVAIGRLQEAEKIVQHVRRECERGYSHVQVIELMSLLVDYDDYVKSTGTA